MVCCAAFAGVFFSAIAYFMVFGDGDNVTAMGASSSPFTDVAGKAGFPGPRRSWRLRCRRSRSETGELKAYNVILAIAGVALMLFAICGSVYPIPAYPFNILPYLFLGYMVVGAIWFAVLKAKSPQVLSTIIHDMEG